MNIVAMAVGDRCTTGLSMQERPQTTRKATSDWSALRLLPCLPVPGGASQTLTRLSAAELVSSSPRQHAARPEAAVQLHAGLRTGGLEAQPVHREIPAHRGVSAFLC